MPRPPRPWFRFHSEALTNLKLHAMPDRLVKPWIFLLCMANEHEPRGHLPSLPKIAFALRIKEERAKSIMADLINLQFVDCIDGSYVMHQWDDWQKDSDANKSPGRAKRHEGTPLEHGRNAVGTRNGTSPADVGTPLERLEKEKEEEKELEREKEADAEDARPPEYPFALMYAEKYRIRNPGRRVPPIEHAAALAIEREFGSQACIDAAGDLNWEKHPNYLKPILEERRNGKRPVGRTAEIIDLANSPFAYLGS